MFCLNFVATIPSSKPRVQVCGAFVMFETEHLKDAVVSVCAICGFESA